MRLIDYLPAIILVAMGLGLGVGVLIAASRLVRRISPNNDEDG